LVRLRREPRSRHNPKLYKAQEVNITLTPCYGLGVGVGGFWATSHFPPRQLIFIHVRDDKKMESFMGRRGKRLRANTVRVSRTKNGQYTITIPVALARAMKLNKGSLVTFELGQGGVRLVKWGAS